MCGKRNGSIIIRNHFKRFWITIRICKHFLFTNNCQFYLQHTMAHVRCHGCLFFISDYVFQEVNLSRTRRQESNAKLFPLWFPYYFTHCSCKSCKIRFALLLANLSKALEFWMVLTWRSSCSIINFVLLTLAPQTLAPQTLAQTMPTGDRPRQHQSR